MKKQLTLLLLLIAALCFQPQAHAQSPLIAFVKSEGEVDNQRLNIWTMRADGSGRKRLTSDGQSSEPAWSPDGRKIAYVVSASPYKYESNPQIWMMNSDGSNKRAITRDTAWRSTIPSFSPDGKQLLFRIDFTGQVEAPNARIGVRRLTLSNLSSRILATADSNTGVFDSYALTPNQQQIYYTESGHEPGAVSLSLLTIKTGKSRVIHEPYKLNNYSMLDFNLSPDGKRIVFASDGANVKDSRGFLALDTKRAGIVMMNANGTGAKLILKGNFETPSWSSDGRKLIFANAYALQTLDLKTGKKIILLRDKGLSSPAFQPSAKRR